MKSTLSPDNFGFWFSGPNIAVAEIGRIIGYRVEALDVEHGSFDHAAADRFIPLLKGLGYEVYAKVGPLQTRH